MPDNGGGLQEKGGWLVSTISMCCGQVDPNLKRDNLTTVNAIDRQCLLKEFHSARAIRTWLKPASNAIPDNKG